MDRRNFLETLLVTSAGIPALAQPTSVSPELSQAEPSTNFNPRVRENFNAGWLFARQLKGTGALGSFDRENIEAAQVEPRFREAQKSDYDDSAWQPIDLPHTWNAHDVTDEMSGYWRGIGWYRRHFKVDVRHSHKRAFLEFEGVNSVSEFWLNDKSLGEHRGGYTSFEFDVTDRLRFGAADNVLTVKVDNLYHSTIPPTVKTDYNFYGGIYRDSWIRYCEPTYVEEIVWTTPVVNKESAELSVAARVMNKTSQACDFSVIHEILDPNGRLAKAVSAAVSVSPAGASHSGCSVTLDRPLLWGPDSPSVYSIRTTLTIAGGVVDRLETPLGFRWFKFDPEQGFILNGERVQIQGTNWHQSYPGMGSALPDSRHVKDMELIRAMGANFWRTSHYPHDPATIQASDHLGLMIWEELPVNKEIGNPPEYIANVLKMADEMIRRDRNNPSVIVWGIAGEINAPLSVSKRVVEAVVRKYRELDPSRPVAMHSPGNDDIEALVDVVGIGADKDADSRHRRYPRRAYMTAEYAAATMGRGLYGMGPESEDLACAKHEGYLRELYARPWMAGGLIWHQFDYDGETYDTVTPHIVAFGMTDVWRIPKDVYYFYQSQWIALPMVHIVGHWTWPGYEGKQKSVKVYSNAEEVELLLNGLSLGRKTVLPGTELPHPPRTWEVEYQPGTLLAIARTGGSEVRDERKTAGPAHHVVLQPEVTQLRSGDRESLAYVTALIVDERGTVVPTGRHPITFTWFGPGELLEQTWLGHGTGLTWNAVAGQTRVAFRSTARTGHAVISAWSPGLGVGRAKINVTAPGTPDEMEYREQLDDGP